MITVKDNEIHTLLANVPNSFIWRLEVFFLRISWLLSTRETKKSWDEAYYGLIKHECKFNYNKLEGDRYKHYSCKHYGCNKISIQDEKGNWL